MTDNENQQLTMNLVDAGNTSEIYKILSGYSNSMILWFDNNEIESRWYDTQNHVVVIPDQFNNITSVAAKRFGDKAFIAISTHVNSLNNSNVIEANFIQIYR